MAGIVYLKSGNQTISLTGSEYTGISMPSTATATLFVQTGNNTTDRVKYGLTTDITASIYSPKIMVDSTKPCYIASGSQWTVTETTGTSYETATSEVEYESSHTLISTTESTAIYTYNYTTQETWQKYVFRTAVESTNIQLRYFDIGYKSEIYTYTNGSISFTASYYTSIDNKPVTITDFTASFNLGSAKTTYYSSRLATSRGTCSLSDQDTTYTFSSTTFSGTKNVAYTTSILPMDNTNYTYGDWGRYTEHVTKTTNTSYVYMASESAEINNNMSMTIRTSTNATQTDSYYTGGRYTHTSTTLASGVSYSYYSYEGTYLHSASDINGVYDDFSAKLYYQGRAEISKYGNNVFMTSHYQSLGTATHSKTYYGRYEATQTKTTSLTQPESTSGYSLDGNLFKYVSYTSYSTDTRGRARRLSYTRKYTSNGSSYGKLAKGAAYMASYTNTIYNRVISAPYPDGGGIPYYHTRTYYYTSESCKVTTSIETITSEDTITTNTVYLTETYTSQTDNCNV